MNGIVDRPWNLVIRSEMPAAGQLLIAVQDSGVGIDPAPFDAFFTTKAQGMGTGLSISHSIIEGHGGRLWASANAGPGTTFQFALLIGQSAPS